MPPKKGGKGKGKAKPKKVVEPEPEIDRSFYDVQITELCHRLSNLRTQMIELEDEHTRLLQEKEDLANDEQDILQYLARATQELNDEILKLEYQCSTVEAARVTAGQEFEMTKEKMMERLHITEDQLLAESKLTVGKMHALEEFRIQRDELMRKYEILEEETEEQKVRHKHEMYDVERKYIIGKDKLKKEMDAKLRWLVEQFLSITDLRVAASNLNVIKQNIALNNKLDEMLQNLRKLYEKHEQLRDNDAKLKLLTDMTNHETTVVGKKALAQVNMLIRTTNEASAMERMLAKICKKLPKLNEYDREDQANRKRIDDNIAKKRILEQNLHEFRCRREEMTNETRQEANRNKELIDMLQQAKDMIDAEMNYNDPYGEGEDRLDAKSTMLYRLYDYLKLVREWNRRPPEIIKLENRDDIYMPGKLSLVPREVILKCMIPRKESKCEQIDASFIDLLEDIQSSEEEEETEAKGSHSTTTIATVIDQEVQTDEERTEAATTPTTSISERDETEN